MLNIEHIFLFLEKFVFLRFLRIQLSQHFFFLRQILKNIDISQQLLTAKANFERCICNIAIYTDDTSLYSKFDQAPDL